MSNQQTFTYQTRFDAPKEQDAALTAYAALYGTVERNLFAALAAGGDASSLKSAFLRRHGITARQYNAVAINLKGKMSSVKEQRAVLINELDARVKKARKVIAKSKNPNKRHQKKRRLSNLLNRLAGLETEKKAEAVNICFGGNKLFRKQFYLEENGYSSHAEWKHDWVKARSNQFFVIGSKDETAGCQGCVAGVQPDGTITLRLRLPDALASKGKYLVVPDVHFSYGQDVIEAAILTRQAISYRFMRDEKGWRVFVSTSYQAPERISDRGRGVIGIDINAGHIAAGETDRFGNFINAARYDCVTYGKSSGQAKAIIGDAVKQVVRDASMAGKPVAIEDIDLKKHKAEMENESPRACRGLSSFAYMAIQNTIRAACYRAGIEVIDVHPAYTSTIGAVNYAQKYGISVHQGAALAIARRSMGYSERPSVQTAVTPVCNGGHVTFPLPARNRGKHVWSFWAKVRMKLKAAHAAHARLGYPKPLRLYYSPAPGSRRALPESPRHVNRQQNCSADVLDDILVQ
jgi:IS605 OrfB family transposase